MKRIPVKIESFAAKMNTGKNTAKAGSATRKAALGGMNMGFNLTNGLGSGNITSYSSYTNMGLTSGVIGDVPEYFQLMNANNGGILYWPISLKEKYSWFRYFAKVDPYVKRAIEFHTDLPMSKLILRMPKIEDKKLREKILRKYEGMIKRIKLFDRLHSMLYESAILGNCFCFIEFDEERKEWGKIVILPPEEIVISKIPMSDQSKVQYRPEILNNIIKQYTIPVNDKESYLEYVEGLPDDEKETLKNIPYELAKQLIENNGTLTMDTDPFVGDDGHKIGSFVYNFSEKRHDYFDLGTSPLECILIPLLMKEHYKYTQLSLASRNMTPRNKISAPDIGEEALKQLRAEVDMSMLNPDYTIVTNYEWSWDLMGAENRLIDLSREYAEINEQLFAGLGITKEILTGEGMYSGSKVSVELLNTRYLLKREMMCNFVEESLFLPIAEENGFYEEDEWGNKRYLYPKLSFTRLSIRDNAEVFDSLFQLYQKGSVPIDIILDLFNMDSDEVHEKLKNDMFTVKDAAYNDMLRSIYNDISSKIAEETDLADQMIEYVTGPGGKKLNRVNQEEGIEEGTEEEIMDYPNEDLEESSDQEVTMDETPEEDNSGTNSTDEELVKEYLDEKDQESSEGQMESSVEDENVAELLTSQAFRRRK